jgi:outer membrane protein assembly factor BamD (BamD/ComL family)
MKTALRLVPVICCLVFIFACASAPDPLKDLPQAEYDQAQKLRTRITALNFVQYAPDDYKTAEDQFKAGEANYKKDNLSAKKSLDAAIVSYRKVLRKGVAELSKQSEDDIAVSMKKADDIKASVATAADYKDAKTTYDKAVALAADDNWEDAGPLFKEAKAKYEKVYETAKAKKDKAQAKFDETKKNIENFKAEQGEPDKANPEKKNP